MEPQPYFYGVDGMDDHGWGCCYRSGQMLLGALGLPVPHLRLMMERCGTLAAYQNGERGQGVWIEPPDVGQFMSWYAPEVRVKEWLYCPQDEAARRMLRHTPAHYRRRFRQPSPLRRRLQRKLRAGVPAVIDNGVSAYLLVGLDEDTVTLLDPHVTAAKDARRTMPARWFWSQPLWMVLSASTLPASE